MGKMHPVVILSIVNAVIVVIVISFRPLKKEKYETWPDDKDGIN